MYSEIAPLSRNPGSVRLVLIMAKELYSHGRSQDLKKNGGQFFQLTFELES